MINKSASRVHTVLILAVILVVTFVSYLPILKGEFLLWDDDVHVLENITIRGLDLEHVLEMFTSTVNKIYIPLTSLSFALEHHFLGYNPFVYHLDNVLLHLLVVVMVFLLGRKLGLSQPAAGMAALIFGIHPIHVESVAWITERKDVLYAAFYMAALLSYLRYLEEKRGYWLWVTTILGALSMLAKPMALSLPLILILLDWFKGRPLEGQAFIEKLPLGVIVGGIAWISYAAHARIPGESVAQSALIWPWTFTFYLRQFFFPYISVPLYRLAKPVLLTNPEYFLSIAVFILVVLALARLRRHKWFVFAVLFYFLSIFFLLRFDETKDVNTVADRFMYLPGLGLCLLLGLGVEWLWKKCGRKNLARPVGSLRGGMVVAGFVVLVVALSYKTFRQCYVWCDSVSLWQHQLKYFSDTPIALNNLATAYGKEKEFERAQDEYKKIMRLGLENVRKGLSPQAVGYVRQVDFLIALYQKAIKSDPRFEDAYYNLGNLYARIGRLPDAVEAYKKALEIDAKFKDVHCGLGDVYVEAGDVRQAIFAFDQALQFHPEDRDLHVMVVKAYTKAIEKNADVAAYRQARSSVLAHYAAMVNKDRPKAASYFNLGNLYVEVGDAGMALLAYRRALEIDPRHSGALYNLGNFYKEQGRPKEALGFYQKALDVDPRMADAWLNMGVIYGRQAALSRTVQGEPRRRLDYLGQRGEKDREKSFYQKALQVDPRNGRAYFNLGFLEEAAGDLPGALGFYQKSVVLDPANAEGHYNLGNVYAKLKDVPEAIAAYLKAVEYDPKHINALVNLSILSFQKEDFAAAVKYCDEAVLLGYDAPEGYLNALAPYRKTGAGN